MFRATIAAFVFSVAGASVAAADTGISMMRIECDAPANKVEIEPFILWNGELTHKAASLNDPEIFTVQMLGSSTYYFVRNRYNIKFDHTCSMNDRTVIIRLKFNQLAVEERSFGRKSGFSVDFDDPSFGGAWYGWGPTYWLISDSSHLWRACHGNEERKDFKCAPVPLTNEGE